MEQIITLLTEEPLYGIVAGVLVLLLVVSIVKQVLLFGLLAAALLLGLTFYLQSSNDTADETESPQEPHKALTRELGEKTRAARERMEKALKEKTDALNRHLKGTVRDQVKERLDDARAGTAEALEEVGEKTRTATEKLGRGIHSAGEKLNKNIKKQAEKLKETVKQGEAEGTDAPE